MEKATAEVFPAHPALFLHRPLDDHRGAAGFVAGRQHHEHFTAPLAPTAKAKPKRARKV